MARIRKIEIENFRCIQQLSWTPSPGINCLIGPGDSGKSSLLDALDYCLGARRALQFNDADFYRLDVAKSRCGEAASWAREHHFDRSLCPRLRR